MRSAVTEEPVAGVFPATPGRGRASPQWKKAEAHGGEAARGMAGWGTVVRGSRLQRAGGRAAVRRGRRRARGRLGAAVGKAGDHNAGDVRDRKSTRLNSSHAD